MPEEPGIVIVREGMEIQDPGVRERVRALTFALLGEGEPLP